MTGENLLKETDLESKLVSFAGIGLLAYGFFVTIKSPDGTGLKVGLIIAGLGLYLLLFTYLKTRDKRTEKQKNKTISQLTHLIKGKR